MQWPMQVMIFDLGMVVFFAILVDLVGMYVIDAFRRWCVGFYRLRR
jgi:hypothetical protein